jgi:LPS O-antigen subunit length determinant protein (WzzB/FepE family)
MRVLVGSRTGVTVFNYAGPDEDAIDVRATGDAVAGKELFRLDLNLVRFFVADTQGTMFDDTAMPASPTFVDQADSHQSLVEFIGANNVRTQLNTGEEPYSLGRYDPLAIISGIQDEINESQASGALNAKLIAPLLQASALLDGRLDQKNIAKARGALEDFIKSVRTNRNKLDQVVADILSFTAQLVRGSIPRCGGS